MERKYIRQFENEFQGKDVIITITKLIRNLKKKELKEDKIPYSPFWSIGEE